MSTDEINLTGGLRRISLKPGDVLVVRCKHKFPVAQIAAIGSELRRLFPDNEHIILDQGTEIGVIGAGHYTLVQEQVNDSIPDTQTWARDRINQLLRD